MSTVRENSTHFLYIQKNCGWDTLLHSSTSTEYVFVDGSTMNLLAYKSQKKYWVKNKDVEIVFPFIKRTKKRKV